MFPLNEETNWVHSHVYLGNTIKECFITKPKRQRSEPNLLITVHPDHYLTKSKNCYR